MTHIVKPDELGIRAAVAALQRGDIIGFPTETVYGLAADITNETAIEKIFVVKGRPRTHPLIVHIADLSQLVSIAADIPTAARVLSTLCWPGPLTVIVRAAPHVSRLVTGGRDTVAVRMPAHSVAQTVITQLGFPVAAPSANRFGHVSPTTAHHVSADLGADVALVLDGGPCDIGVESTIVDCTLAQPQILRPGAITQDDIQHLLDEVSIALSTEITGPARASGMLERHYSPAAQLLLHEVNEEFDSAGAPVLNCAVDPVMAARLLYAQLRALDDDGSPLVHIVLPPPRGIGYALRDRLVKAASPR